MTRDHITFPVQANEIVTSCERIAAESRRKADRLRGESRTAEAMEMDDAADEFDTWANAFERRIGDVIDLTKTDLDHFEL